MKVIKVKKLWKGMIPVRAKYVDDAVKNRNELGVIVEGRAYKLSLSQLENPHASIVVADHFGGKPQKLYYFKQSPQIYDDTQRKLF